MSCVLSLTAAAVIAGISLASTMSVSVVAAMDEKELDVEEGIETVFVDSDILIKTLHDEYDCHLNVISENEIEVVTTAGNLIYKRESADQPYMLYLNKIEDVDALIENIKSFEYDYGRNVQAYTYGHIKETLADNMQIVDEEVLEDDSLYLTINVE